MQRRSNGMAKQDRQTQRHGTTEPAGPPVAALHRAERRCLQALVREFELVRIEGDGLTRFALHLAIDDETPAIWNEAGVRHVKAANCPREVLERQGELDAFFFQGGKDLASDTHLKVEARRMDFRYGSGGTLPVVVLDEKERTGAKGKAEGKDGKRYYALAFREIDPVGWNLLNGGTDNRRELMNPGLACEREFLEEFVVLGTQRRARLPLAGREGAAAEDPAQAMALRLWDKRHPGRGFRTEDPRKLDVAWVDGPDRVIVRMGDADCEPCGGVFLNVNAEDAGIEVDRVATIVLPRGAVVCFGEVADGKLVDCPIGLFEVGRFPADAAPEALARTELRPDWFFFGGALRKKQDFDGVMAKEFPAEMEAALGKDGLRDLEEARAGNRMLGLCPVAARAILRHRRWEAERGAAQPAGGGREGRERLREGRGDARGDGFVASPNYANVVWRGRTYLLGKGAARIVGALHAAQRDRKLPGLHQDELLEEIYGSDKRKWPSRETRVRNFFRSGGAKALWVDGCVAHDGRGHFRLNVGMPG